jgi:hypothetical protein
MIQALFVVGHIWLLEVGVWGYLSASCHVDDGNTEI